MLPSTVTPVRLTSSSGMGGHRGFCVLRSNAASCDAVESAATVGPEDPAVGLAVGEGTDGLAGDEVGVEGDAEVGTAEGGSVPNPSV